GQTAIIFNINKPADRAHPALDLVHKPVQLTAVHTADQQFNGFAFGRAAFLFAKFQFNAGNVSSALPEVVEYFGRGAAGKPVIELELQNPDHIRCHLITRGEHGTGIQGFDFRHVLQAAFNLAHNRIALPNRQIATGSHLHLSGIRLDTGEKFYAVVESTVRSVDNDDHRQ